MENPFFDISKDIANNFLQNIVFIDDKAFLPEDETNHNFNALEISKVFANSQKVCAVYKPESTNDLENIAQLAKKADITVIDWQINIVEENTGNEEEDAEEDDPRGPHTRKIIREILTDPITGKGSLKLIVIYTGEIGLYDITNEIFNDLKDNGIEDVQKGDCQVYTDNINILIVAKAANNENKGEPKFKHAPELNEKVVSYEDLPEFILTEFTKMTSGLLTNFVLNSYTILRNNTFRLIKLFNKELDPPFLFHRLLLPIQDDSKEQLIEILSHSIQALLNYNKAGESISISNIFQWLDKFEFKDSVSVSKKDIILENELLKSLFSNGLQQTLEELWKNNDYGELSKNAVKSFEKKLHEKGSSFLMDADNSDAQDCAFSILTHHKSDLKQESLFPVLSLGSLIKEIDGERYFLCIQAKCDSVRFEIERKFLFLQLDPAEDNSKFQIVVENDGDFIRLKIKNEAFELRTIKFVPNQDSRTVIAILDAKRYIFESIYSERFVWLADLKDAHAQRVASNYANQLSRVGLDESEWLRRWAEK